jgi:hypothetical protein
MKPTKTTGSARMAREWEILEKMVQLYCRRQHRRRDLCEECQQLLKSSRMHLESCRFGSDKPVCANCSFHCFGHTGREKVKAVIGTARPHMVWRYPRLSLRHWLDGFHQAPASSVRADYSSWGGE